MILEKIFHQAQYDAYQKLVAARGGIVWHKVGEGKTRVAILAAKEIAENKVILVVGRRIAFNDWRNEIATLQIDCEVKELEGIVYNEKFSKKKPTFLFMSWGKWPNGVLFDLLLHHLSSIGCIILDEGWLYKNPKSLTHQTAAKVTANKPTILLSGSIMPAKDIVDIYGQVSVVGRAATLAPTLSKFRSAYQMGISGNFFSWYPKKGAYQQIIDRISPFTHIHFPPNHDRKIHHAIKSVPATEQQQKYFTELKQYAEIEGKLELNSMAAVIIKAQQISDGWLKLSDGSIEYFDSHKIKAVIAEIEELFYAGETSVVVWCAFREDVTRLRNELEPHFCNVAIVTLRGGEIFNEPKWKKAKTRIAIATMSSGSSFNFFGQVAYAIYFSQDWKWLSLEQSGGRHMRRDSLHNIAHFTFLHTEDSLDSKIYYIVKSAAMSERTFIRKLDVHQWLSGS